MIDLTGIARRLRLSVDQIRIAADLLDQGYHPSFIQRYRADESGNLPESTVWALKLEIDRLNRLESARNRAKSQLPKDSALDEEAEKCFANANSELEIEVAMRCWRARRNLGTQERDPRLDTLLEKLIAYSGSSIANMQQWVATELSVDASEADQLVQKLGKFVGVLLQGDTEAANRMRRQILKKAQIEVKECAQPANDNEAPAEDSQSSTEASEQAISAEQTAESTASEDKETEAATESVTAPAGDSIESAGDGPEAAAASDSGAAAETPIQETAPPTSGDSPAASEPPAEQPGTVSVVEGNASTADSESASEPAAASESTSSAAVDSPTSPDQSAEAEDLSFPKAEKSGKEKSAKNSGRKSAAKLTPRQRRRRWLSTMLQSMKNLKRQVTKLTAYQQLMLGRGRRSQLIATELKYDNGGLIAAARDSFVAHSHGASSWFEESVRDALNTSLRAKIEADALGILEEQAQDKLLESATDQLRQSLMRRPVRGHIVMLVDTVGPKTSSVAVVGPAGEVLHTDEVMCSAHSDAVSQNLIRLGEIAHRFKVTLVALTNGPARRYLILSVRELIQQSAESGLRWTMADRSGAEAYAVGRIALRELPAYNRRDRAAIWAARCLQNPLEELLKVDVNRLRLGSYQRELAQDALKSLIRETVADCVSSRGLDVRKANVDGLQCVCGVADEQAQQIATLAANGSLTSREELKNSVTQWPDTQARQALGFLRVFGGDQSLDATLIHPDDYRLAERLVANTDLENPPNAPEGWEPPALETTAAIAPESVTERADEGSDQESSGSIDASDATDPLASGTSESTSESTSDSAAESLPAVDAATPIDSPETTNDTNSAENAESAPSDSDAASSPATPAESSAENTSESEPAESTTSEGEPQTDANGAPQADSAPQAESATASEPERAPLPAADPEYPEQVLASRTKAKEENSKVDIEKLARGWQVGRRKLAWIASCLDEPFADPRLDLAPVPLLSEMPTLGSLKPDMCIWAVVVGVADFGAFVEIAPDCSGLVHISRLSANYVEDPHQVVQVGDLLMVWVVNVDEKKKRVALTALSPEERAAAKAHSNRGPRRDEDRPSRGPRGGGHRGGDRSASGDRSGNRDRGRTGRGRDQGGSGYGRKGAKPHGRSGKSGGGARSIVVKSKKESKPISDAMKEGDEPLRSFSDLMQFYEAKRTDVPAPKKSDSGTIPAESSVATKVVTVAEAEEAKAEPNVEQPEVAKTDADSAHTEAPNVEAPATEEAAENVADQAPALEQAPAATDDEAASKPDGE